MRTRRKILIGVATFALPATSFVVLGGPNILAGASLTPSFPVACKITATVTFTPSLTMTGTITANKNAVTTMAVTAATWNGCLSAAPATAPTKGIPLDQTINLPATKVGTKKYAIGYCGLFSAVNLAKTLKAFKTPKPLSFGVAWSPGVRGSTIFTMSKVAITTNSDTPLPELGLVFSGKQSQGSYPEKALNQITEFFDGTDSHALQTGCSLNQTVGTATFDPSNSVGIL
jgi:hypothetical protein